MAFGEGNWSALPSDLGFVFAPKVPALGSLWRLCREAVALEVGWAPPFFSFWRRPLAVGGKAGDCGFAAWGDFVGGLPPFRWPLPWPLPIASLLGRGIELDFGRGKSVGFAF